MPPTTGFSFGDTVLIPFPFTDQRGLKTRPAVVVSSTAKKAGLLVPSAVKPLVTTIEKGLVLKRLGQLQQVDIGSLRASIGVILG